MSASPARTTRERVIAIRVTNADTQHDARSVRTSTRFPPGTHLDVKSAGCRSDGEQLLCEHGGISPGTTVSAEVLASLPLPETRAATDDSELVATIVPGSETIDITPLNNSVTLDRRARETRHESSRMPSVFDDSGGVGHVGPLGLGPLALLLAFATPVRRHRTRRARIVNRYAQRSRSTE